LISSVLKDNALHNNHFVLFFVFILIVSFLCSYFIVLLILLIIRHSKLFSNHWKCIITCEIYLWNLFETIYIL